MKDRSKDRNSFVVMNMIGNNYSLCLLEVQAS